MKPHCYFIGTTLGDNPVPHHFVALARELARRGHRVVLLAPHRRVDLQDPMGNPAVYTWPSERPTRWRDALFLLRLIRQFQPATLIANFAAVNMMTTVGWLGGVPNRVVWYRTMTAQLSRDYETPQWKTRLLRMRKKMVYHAATHMVANSLASATDLQSIYAVPTAKCRVFFNSLADPLAGGQLSIAPAENKLVCVGRLFPSKGQDVLIRALALLQQRFPGVQAEFVGQGPALGALSELAGALGVKERCVFSGQVPHEQVLRKMAGATVTVVPSRSEAFGLVNIESLAVGTPVVGSAVGGILEIIRDGQDGFLVPPENPEALAGKLAVVLGSPELRRQMSLNARQRFLSCFEQGCLVREQADWQETLAAGGMRAA